MVELVKNMFVSLQGGLRQYTWWELTIFVIGMVSFLAIFFILFLPLGNGPSKFTTTANVPKVTSIEFVQLLSESLNLPAKPGNSIKILNNGDQFLASFLSDIDSAHSSINIMVYIWDKGKMSDQIFKHLDVKLKEGVDVRIMVDAFGASGAIDRQEFKTFKDLGGKVQIFHSLTLVPWNIISNQKRNHRRAFIIDGQIGYIGGMAMSDLWLGDARNPLEYRDVMFRTTGPMVGDVQGAFAELWASNTGELLAGDKFFPPVGTSTESLKLNTVTYVPLSSTPTLDTLTIQKFILFSILGAEKKIYITTPYFLPDKFFIDTLIAKVKNGVDVRILVPNDYNDNAGVRHASQYYYEDLLKGGVKIYEYQPTFIHVKTIVIDGSWSIIGSANLDNRSKKLNEENIFGVSSGAFGTELENIFLNDLTHAKQITLIEWNKRSVWQRIREIFDLKFVQQY